jgi:uncharacterized membrane protein YfcA
VTPAGALLLLGSGGIAGAINAIAGGGSLITFPVAMATGLSSLVANATNSVAVTPAALATAWGYRREIENDRALVRLFAWPAICGGVTGAVLLVVTPPAVFDAVVPALVLLATGLLLFQNLRRQPVPTEGVVAAWTMPKSVAVAVSLQFLVAIYGGYFGAGLGILTLAVFSLLGGRDINRMNGLKMVLGAITNGVAALGFIVAKIVDYPTALLIMAGASAGGYAGARIARRTDPRVVRWAVVAVGVALSAILARKRWG